MFSATDNNISAYWDPLEQFQHAHDPQDHHYLQDIPQMTPGLDGKGPIKVPGKGHEEEGHLVEAVRRRRPLKENVGVGICKEDGVVLRVCVHCNTSKTPLWRGGPAGPMSLCNACGIRYGKRECKDEKEEKSGEGFIPSTEKISRGSRGRSALNGPVLWPFCSHMIMFFFSFTFYAVM